MKNFFSAIAILIVIFVSSSAFAKEVEGIVMTDVQVVFATRNYGQGKPVYPVFIKQLKRTVVMDAPSAPLEKGMEIIIDFEEGWPDEYHFKRVKNK